MDKITGQIGLFSGDYEAQVGQLYLMLSQAIVAHSGATFQSPRRDRLTTPEDRLQDYRGMETCEENARLRDLLASQIYLGLTGKRVGEVLSSTPNGTD